MNCPKAEAMTRCDNAIATITYLMRQEGMPEESVSSAINDLFYVREYLKRRPCPGDKQ